jgi:hypothetical protein
VSLLQSTPKVQLLLPARTQHKKQRHYTSENVALSVFELPSLFSKAMDAPGKTAETNPTQRRT